MSWLNMSQTTLGIYFLRYLLSANACMHVESYMMPVHDGNCIVSHESMPLRYATMDFSLSE